MKRIFLILILFSVIISANQKQKLQSIGVLKLANGNVIQNCIIGFRTIGEINEDSSNVVVITTWFGGTSEYASKLVGTDRLIDSTKYFIIVIDALGNGVSSSPSNYNDFPDISIKDMVNSQYILLTKHFKLKNIFAMIGGSMGGMQILEWVVSYPNFIKKAIPYVPSPRRSTYEQLAMRFNKVLIDELKANKVSDDVTQKLINYIDEIFARTPEYIIENVKFTDLDKYLFNVENKKSLETFTVDNYYSQLNALIEHNIYSKYNNSVAETAKNIKTKLLFIVATRDILVHPSSAIELANAMNAEVFLLDNLAGHLAVSYDFKKCFDKIKIFLDEN